MTRTGLLCGLGILSTVALGARPEEPCKFPGAIAQEGLAVRQGFVEFLPAAQLAPFKAALPKLAQLELAAAMTGADTMWYDEDSMVFAYQDSIETVVGMRANCVGRMVGERNKNNPQISKLMKLFGEDYRFMFPFRKAAGTDEVENVRVLNFWAPPRFEDKVLPVRYWRPERRGHSYWTFPVGTIFGEVLYEKSPEGKWYVFEVRTRKRYRDGWEVNLFRPFLTAESLAGAIIAKRPQWESSPSLKALVTHLRDKSTLVPHRMESVPYAKVFEPVDGALDPLPAIDDSALVTELLTKTTFVSAEGAIWKENGQGLETYAPASQGDFHIVPKGYEMGMIPVNEVSCNRCHSDTGRNLGQFEFDAILYGEIWGEDRIFTWHPFQPHQYIYDTWDDADVQSRKLNPRLLEASLVVEGKPAASDTTYKPLPSAFTPDNRARATRPGRKGN